MGGGGKGGGGPSIDPKLAQQAYDNAYKNSSSGGQWAYSGAPDYEQYARQVFSAGTQDYQLKKQLKQMSQSFALPEIPQPEGPSYEEQLAEQQRIQGTQNRDTLFSKYMDAASAATDYVNGEIKREQANAKLLGIDYNISDEQKKTRINNYFATLWGEGQQSQLEALMNKWGNPEGFTGFDIVRGDASAYKKAKEGKETTVGKTKGIKPVLLSDEDTLGTKSILGG